MINLLPSEDQKQLRAARSNALLLRYVVISPLLIVFLVAEMVVIYFVMNATQDANKKTITDNAARTAEYADTKKEADSYRANLQVAKSILNTQVPYTKILVAIAQKLPNGATVEQISVDSSALTTPTTLKLHVASYAQAVEVKNKLQTIEVNSKPIFTDAKIQKTSHISDENSNYFEAIYDVTYSKEILP